MIRAGSYKHCVKNDGTLRTPADLCEMLETSSGDVYEAIEEMYGMIWYLAYGQPDLVEEARTAYSQGIALFAPGDQKARY